MSILFKVKVRNENGKVKRLKYSENSFSDLKVKLAKENLELISVKRGKDEKSLLKRDFYFTQNVSTDDLLIFTRNLSTLLNAGVSLSKSLRKSQQNAKNLYFKMILDEIVENIESGTDFDKAFAKYPKVFDEMYVSMVKSGLASGKLDVFQKDWISFFSGRSDEDLKAPSDAFRFSFFPQMPLVQALDVSIMPYSSPDINLQTEGRFTSLNPIYPFYLKQGMVINPILESENKLENTEVAARLKFKNLGTFTPMLYGYHGRFNNPYSMKFDGQNQITPYYSKLNVYGASLRGQALQGIISLEGGYYDSVEDRDGDNPLVENSSLRFLALYETSLTTTLDLGVQYYTEIIQNYEDIEENFNPLNLNPGDFMDKDGLRDEVRNLFTIRLTKKLLNETLWLTWFSYFSPTDEDYYFRPRISYDYSDNIRLSLTGNILGAYGDNDDDGNYTNNLPDYHNTMFGQFNKDNNVNLTVKYVF